MDLVDFFDEQVVSRRAELPGRMVGRRLVRLVRHSWWPAEEALERLREVDAKRGPKTVFSLTAGPLSVELDSGLILGFGSRPSEASVTVWVEREEAEREPGAEGATTSRRRRCAARTTGASFGGSAAWLFRRQRERRRTREGLYLRDRPSLS